MENAREDSQPLLDAAGRRPRRARDDIRSDLIDAAIVEFGAHGFAGASTRAIAARADAHQPQINYHFASKYELWQAAVNELYQRLDKDTLPLESMERGPAMCAELFRMVVRFSAKEPDLHRILVHESSNDTERLQWLTETHTRTRFELLRDFWVEMLEQGVAAPLSPDFVHHVVYGASSLFYTSAPEARLLLRKDIHSEEMVEAHAENIVAMLLPGYDLTQ